jgi:hypothetical protein
MAEEDEASFRASPEVAAQIIEALKVAGGDDVSGFAFGELMPRVTPGKSPLRPKDGGRPGGLPNPTEAAWTTWTKIG